MTVEVSRGVLGTLEDEGEVEVEDEDEDEVEVEDESEVTAAVLCCVVVD